MAIFVATPTLCGSRRSSGHGAYRVRPIRGSGFSAPCSAVGAALVEWLLGMTALMLLAAISLEFAHWQTSRHVAAIALMEAARAGSVQNAHPRAMQDAFLHAMSASFPAGEGNEALMLRTFERIKSRTHMPAWEIEQLAPDAQAFEGASRYTGQEIAQALGKRVLRHDLYERDGQPRHLGATRAPGARARMSLNRPQNPNHPQALDGPLTLHIRLTYRQPALFPIITRLMAALVSKKQSTTRAWAAGLIVIELEQKIEMQSHAIQW